MQPSTSSTGPVAPIVPSSTATPNQVPSSSSSTGPSLPPADCKLKDLVLGPGMSFYPVFDPDVHRYSCACLTSIFLTAVTATVRDQTHLIGLAKTLNNATVMPLRSGVESASYELQHGVNEIVVSTTADGCHEDYTLRCIRYTLNATDIPGGTLYNWRGSDFDACNATCAIGQTTGYVSGIFSRNVLCVNEAGTIVDDSFCPGTRPPMQEVCVVNCAVVTQSSVVVSGGGGGGTVTPSSTISAASHTATAAGASIGFGIITLIAVWATAVANGV